MTGTGEIATSKVMGRNPPKTSTIAHPFRSFADLDSTVGVRGHGRLTGIRRGRHPGPVRRGTGRAGSAGTTPFTGIG